MGRQEKGLFVNVSLRKDAWALAKELQSMERLATISDIIKKALDHYKKSK